MSDLHDRLSELAAMKDGWLDGDGIAPTEDALCTMENFPQPHWFPTPQGGVQAEWSYAGWSWSVTIDELGSIESIDAVPLPPSGEVTGEQA